MPADLPSEVPDIHPATMGDALKETFWGTQRSEKRIAAVALELEKVTAKMDRLFSVRGVLAVVGLIVSGVLLAALLGWALWRLGVWAYAQMELDSQWLWTIVVGLVGAGLWALIAKLAGYVRGLLSDKTPEAK